MRHLSGFAIAIFLGGCAFLTGADELETGSVNEDKPDGSSSSPVKADSAASGSEGGSPGVPDGSPPDIFLPDGGLANPRAGVSCGNVSCVVGAHCCLTPPFSFMCGPSCPGAIGDITCDDGFDCPGKVCCGEYVGSVVGSSSCRDKCDDPDAVILCASDQDCPSSKCEVLNDPLATKYRACRRGPG